MIDSLPDIVSDKVKAHLKELEALFSRMNTAYRETVDRNGFSCEGCEDNCCRTYFFHYTVSEFLFLIAGLEALKPEEKESIVERARALSGDDVKEAYLCPLNTDGRCGLYTHRTMICRLHGIAYRVRRPDGRIVEGPGCDRFEQSLVEKGMTATRLDRTDFYTDLARIEGDVRRSLNLHDLKFKKTIAEMIVDWDDGTWKTVLNNQV